MFESTVLGGEQISKTLEITEVWHLNFNANKCEITRVTHNRDKSVPHYTLVPRGERLSSVSSVKDLAITISHDLSWTLHVVEVVNKANKVLGLIKRIIGFVNKEIFSTLYKALVYGAPFVKKMI